jgi:hypothetical protein
MDDPGVVVEFPHAFKNEFSIVPFGQSGKGNIQAAITLYCLGRHLRDERVVYNPLIIQ